MFSLNKNKSKKGLQLPNGQWVSNDDLVIVIKTEEYTIHVHPYVADAIFDVMKEKNLNLEDAVNEAIVIFPKSEKIEPKEWS